MQPTNLPNKTESELSDVLYVYKNTLIQTSIHMQHTLTTHQSHHTVAYTQRERVTLCMCEDEHTNERTDGRTIVLHSHTNTHTPTRKVVRKKTFSLFMTFVYSQSSTFHCLYSFHIFSYAHTAFILAKGEEEKKHRQQPYLVDFVYFFCSLFLHFVHHPHFY